MKKVTLSELCEKLNVSRRAVQGYEKHNLVSPCGKTERGYLLYDEFAQKRIERIRLFQRLGFPLKKIGELMDAPAEALEDALEKQLEKLKKEKNEKEECIRITLTLLDRIKSGEYR